MVSDNVVEEYIKKYKNLGYTDEQIKSALIKSDVSSSILDKFFVQKKSNSNKHWFILFFGIVIFVGVVLLILLSFVSSGDCSGDGVCPEGYVCSENQCVQKVGVLKCQIEFSCEEGYECYKCLKDTVL